MKKSLIIYALLLASSFALAQRFPPGALVSSKRAASGISPQGWWKLNDGSGTTAVDSSGNGRNGTLNGTGGPAWGTGPNSNGDISFSTTSTDQYIDCGATGLQPTTTGTFMCWFKMSTDVSSFEVIMSNGSMSGSEANGVNLYVQGGKAVGNLNNGTTTHVKITGSTTLTSTPATWYHVAITWDGANLNLYLNGASDATAVAQTADPTPAYNLTIGDDGAHTAGSNWQSEIDDARVYNVALTAAEVLAIYSAGAQ